MENYVIAQPRNSGRNSQLRRSWRPHRSLDRRGRLREEPEEGLYNSSGEPSTPTSTAKNDQGKSRRVLKVLAKEEMVVMEGRDLEASRFGKRYPNSYIDPMSAVILPGRALQPRPKKMTDFSLLHLISRTPDGPTPSAERERTRQLGVMAESQSDEIMGSFQPVRRSDSLRQFLSELKASLRYYRTGLANCTETRYGDQESEPGDLLRLVQEQKWLVSPRQRTCSTLRPQRPSRQYGICSRVVFQGSKAELVKLSDWRASVEVSARMMYTRV